MHPCPENPSGSNRSFSSTSCVTTLGFDLQVYNVGGELFRCTSSDENAKNKRNGRLIPQRTTFICRWAGGGTYQPGPSTAHHRSNDKERHFVPQPHGSYRQLRATRRDGVTLFRVDRRRRVDGWAVCWQQGEVEAGARRPRWL